MTRPVRLQLSRRAGFDLQAHSRSTNGLGAVHVARGRRNAYGNPFTIAFCQNWFGIGVAKAREHSVRLFREWITGTLPPGWTAATPPTPEEIAELRGKNLACWCPLDQPCHADVLLELANKERR